MDGWGGMGYDAVMCYDVSENMGSNPWTEDAELETLPVYRNPAYSSSGLQGLFERGAAAFPGGMVRLLPGYPGGKHRI